MPKKQPGQVQSWISANDFMLLQVQKNWHYLPGPVSRRSLSHSRSRGQLKFGTHRYACPEIRIRINQKSKIKINSQTIRSKIIINNNTHKYGIYSPLSRDSGIVPGNTVFLVPKRRDFVPCSQIYFPGPAHFLSRSKSWDDCPSLVPDILLRI